MQDLKVTLIQTTLYWEQPSQNYHHFEQLFEKISSPGDLLLLPEMFNTGFSINPECFAEEMDGPSVKFLKNQAKRMDVSIMTTLMIMEKNHFFNRLIYVDPDGRIQTYNKRHLFRLSEEFKIIRGGQDKLLIDLKGWKISPLICYDLRFPVWSKNRYVNGRYEYDLLVYLANWPGSRSNVWKTLLTARAMENQSYVIGVNRIGMDGFETYHSGDSMILDPKGNFLFLGESGKEEIHTLVLSAEELKLFRDSFTVGMDWDRFTIAKTN